METIGDALAIECREQLLQFGHGGEAVETTGRERGLYATLPLLQFGHGGEAVETSLFASRPTKN